MVEMEMQEKVERQMGVEMVEVEMQEKVERQVRWRWYEWRCRRRSR